MDRHKPDGADPSAIVSATQPAEQEKNDDDDQENAQYAAQSPAAIISPAVTVEATATEQQHEHDNEQYE
jgi:hypothetical protein